MKQVTYDRFSKALSALYGQDWAALVTAQSDCGEILTEQRIMKHRLKAGERVEQKGVVFPFDRVNLQKHNATVEDIFFIAYMNCVLLISSEFK